MQKFYVSVESTVDSDGIVLPTRIRWDDGRCWDVRKVLHTCRPAHHECEGIRYPINIGRAEKYLYRDGQRWYVDYSP